MTESPQRSYTIIGADGKSYGTTSLDQLRRWVAEGRVVANSPIQTPDTTQPQPAAELPELGDLFRSEEFVASEEGKIPWERRQQLGFFVATLETYQRILLSPAKTFRGMDPRGGYRQPLIFALLSILVVNALGVIVGQSLGFIVMGWQLGGQLGQWGGNALRQLIWQMLAIGIYSYFTAAFFAILDLLLVMVVSHFILRLLQAGGGGFQATARVCSYSVGTGILLSLIPVLGNLLCPVYIAVLTGIGFREVHRTSPQKAGIVMILCLAVWILNRLTLATSIAQYLIEFFMPFLQ